MSTKFHLPYDSPSIVLEGRSQEIVQELPHEYGCYAISQSDVVSLAHLLSLAALYLGRRSFSSEVEGVQFLLNIPHDLINLLLLYQKKYLQNDFSNNSLLFKPTESVEFATGKESEQNSSTVEISTRRGREREIERCFFCHSTLVTLNNGQHNWLTMCWCCWWSDLYTEDGNITVTLPPPPSLPSPVSVPAPFVHPTC